MANRQLGRGVRENSIDGIFVIPDDQGTPRREMSEIPQGMEFPEEAISGALFNVLEHTVAYLEPGDVALGGHIIDCEDTPTPTSGKRRSIQQLPNAPAAKRVASNPSPVLDAAGPASEPPQMCNTLGVLEVDLVHVQIAQPNEARTSSPSRVIWDMFRNFTSGSKMFRALQLLEYVSSPGDSMRIPGLVLVTPFATNRGVGPGARMLAASRLARKFLRTSDINPSFLKLQSVMCYLVLYLTLENTIIPQIRYEHPSFGPRKIAGMKYKYFYDTLGDDADTGTEDVPHWFKQDIGFGKTLWTFVQQVGISAVLMLAAGDPGITVITRAISPESVYRDELIEALSSSRAWWSFAHATGPATLRTFFGPRNIHYTVPQLLLQLRTEPLPAASIVELNKSCRLKDINVEINTQPPMEQIFPIKWDLGDASDSSSSTTKVCRHPTVNPLREIKRRNVWDCLASDTELEPVFSFLVSSDQGPPSNDVVDFLCDLYNKRAIPKRKAVPFAPLLELSNPRSEHLTHQQRLETLVEGDLGGTSFELLVFAVPFDTVFSGVILFPQEATASIFNWTADSELPAKVCEVSTISSIN